MFKFNIFTGSVLDEAWQPWLKRRKRSGPLEAVQIVLQRCFISSFLIEWSRFCSHCFPVINGQVDDQQRPLPCTFFFFSNFPSRPDCPYTWGRGRRKNGAALKHARRPSFFFAMLILYASILYTLTKINCFYVCCYFCDL
jgi:hypothetical protein